MWVGVVGLLCIVGMFGMQTHHVVMWRGLGCKVLLLVSFFYIFDDSLLLLRKCLKILFVLQLSVLLIEVKMM